jgi:hypothetical protein
MHVSHQGLYDPPPLATGGPAPGDHVGDPEHHLVVPVRVVVGDMILGTGSVEELDHLLAIPRTQIDVQVEDHVRSRVPYDVVDQTLQAASALVPLRAGATRVVDERLDADGAQLGDGSRDLIVNGPSSSSTSPAVSRSRWRRYGAAPMDAFVIHRPRRVALEDRGFDSPLGGAGGEAPARRTKRGMK